MVHGIKVVIRVSVSLGNKRIGSGHVIQYSHAQL